MITLFVTTSKIRVIIIIVVKKSCLTTNRATRVILHLFRNWTIGCELMIAVTAEIFLMTIFIFAITIK